MENFLNLLRSHSYLGRKALRCVCLFYAHIPLLIYNLVELIYQRLCIPHRVRNSPHHRFANDIFMLMVDLFLGAFLWPLMFEFLFKPSIFFHLYVDPFFHNYLCNMITWFMGWPAGFKLNSPLNSFLGNMFLWSLHVWRGFILSLF